ncbi:UNVERIFIED_CONTAM: hypothetical protein Scaly_0858700 [Sesamum calycinum]|uniref:Helitron helicase-like domain-containing protein n=1 Tax=Sesamum calycinum TaxID=2727403 RepID=A0AAW2QWV8_9LAMI
MGGKVDTSVQDGRGPPCFKISSENYHPIGSLLPSPGCMNSFVQLYICDAENEVRNRLRVLRDGGPRNMMQHYQDSIAICRAIGPPDFFITFTCNPNWPKVSRKLLNLPDRRTKNRPDIVPRIFRMKLKQLMEHFKEKRFFGNVLADILVIEFQKRGLPHSHTTLTLSDQDKPITPKDIDELICAEIPNKDADPLAYATVVRYMIHGPSIESYWRIHEFELQKHSPAIERLQYHLPNQQFVVFCEEDHLYNIVNRERIHDTMLTKWFDANKKYMEARSLLYVEFPTAWVWKRATKDWVMRKHGKCIGRYFVPGETSDHEQNMNPPELLNSIKVSGIPHHCLELKKEAPVMLMRNLNQSLGLCFWNSTNCLKNG